MHRCGLTMCDDYSHLQNNLFYIVENVISPVEPTAEYEKLSNDYNSQITEHCSCDNFCSLPFCQCLKRSSGINYRKHCQDDERYVLEKKIKSDPIFECNYYCSCSKECGNRLVQRGPVEGLEIRSCDRGLGLFASCFMPEGTFVCEYAGELITKSQANLRHKTNHTHNKMNYIFCLKEHSGDKVFETFVDPSVFGNIGRYINHSCEPNCYIIPVRCDSPVPKLAIFSCMDVLVGEELTFHYGSCEPSDSTTVYSGVKCLCNSASCSGFMPFQKY